MVQAETIRVASNGSLLPHVFSEGGGRPEGYPAVLWAQAQPALVEGLAAARKTIYKVSADESVAVQKKWMPLPIKENDYFQWIGAGLFLALGIGFLLTIWVYVLRVSVARKTVELAREKANLHALIQSIPDLVWVKDVNGIYLNCNPCFERLYGAPLSRIVGKTDFDFVSPDMAAMFRENDRLALESGQPRSNEEWLRNI